MESPGAWSPDRLMLSKALRNRWSSTAAIRRSCSSTAEITARTSSRSGAESVESAPSVNQFAALSNPPRAARHRVESAGASQLKRLMTSKVRRNCWPFTVAGASASGWPVDPVSCPARSAAQTGRESRNAASIDLVQVMATRVGKGRWLQGRPRRLWTRSRSRFDPHLRRAISYRAIGWITRQPSRRLADRAVIIPCREMSRLPHCEPEPTPITTCRS